MARLLVIMVAVVAIALVHSAGASEVHADPSSVIPDPRNVEVVIHNNFTDDELTIQCNSDTKKYPTVHLLHPREMYKFSFNPRFEHQWKCAIATLKKDDVCGTVHKGEFIMWKSKMPPRSRWIVDKVGLWLMREGKVLVYKWPANIHGC